MNPKFVENHSFVPLIHYDKLEIKYKKDPITGIRHIIRKNRPIKYASHRDSCIFSYYSYKLCQLLDDFYASSGIGGNVIAYRSLGRSNYHFSSEALDFARNNFPVVLLAFDVTGFFDNLDHFLLKSRLKKVIGCSELPADWYNVYRACARFHYVILDELKAHPILGERISNKTQRIASIEEIKDLNIVIHPNPEIAKGIRRGIAQGTPISAAFSNLYMIEFDVSLRKICDEVGAFYRRYSDDILVICKPDCADTMEAEIVRLLDNERLAISHHKTERTLFDFQNAFTGAARAAQYLGFTLSEQGPAIRQSSLARQWRKLKTAIRKAEKSADWRAATNQSTRVFTKKLYRRFSHMVVSNGKSLRALRNFSSYGRRSAAVFGPNEKISHQVKRFERSAARKIKALRTRHNDRDK